MYSKIKQDEEQFLDIVKGNIRDDLYKYLSRGDITLPRYGDKDNISIPVDKINLPTFRYGAVGGVGQGEGEQGQDLGPVKHKPKDDDEKSAGQGSSEDYIEVEVPVHEFKEWLHEVLELPNIEPRGNKSILSDDYKYTQIRNSGARSLLHKKRTLKQALKRSLVEGTYNPEEPELLPIKDDFRYRSWQETEELVNSAVLIYMMDVSGSMGQDERELVRRLCAFCEFWLSWSYKGLEIEYIVHDGQADIVNRDKFFSTKRTGGTVASTAHELCIELIENKYLPSEYNIYPMYFSDGFNWQDDDELCMDMIEEDIIPQTNQYSYIEIAVKRSWWSAYSSTPSTRFSSPGNFGKKLEDRFSDVDTVIQSRLKTEEDIIKTLEDVFSTGA